MLEVFRFMFRLTMGVLPEEGRGPGGGDRLICLARGAATVAAASAKGGKGGDESEVLLEEVLLAPSMTRISARGWVSFVVKGLAGR